MANVINDMKQLLAKLDFPASAREALSVLEQLCTTGINQKQQQDAISEIIGQFVFCEVDYRGRRKKVLSALQELQLIDVLSNFLSFPSSETSRNAVFFSLFDGTENISSGFEHDRARPTTISPRLRILARLISFCIATTNKSALHCVALWVQQQGCTNGSVKAVMTELSQDLFLLTLPKSDVNPSSPCLDALKNIPVDEPLFAAYFISSAGQVFSGDGESSPPFALLQTVIEWLSSHPNLVTVPLLAPAPSLPNGFIAMPPVSPVLALLRWTIALSVGAVGTHNTKSGCSDEEISEMGTRLQLALLQGLQTPPPREAVDARQLSLLLNSLAPMFKLLEESNGSSDITMQTSLDYLGQVLALTIKQKWVYGNTSDVWHCVKQLPGNKLLQLLVKQHG